MLGYACAAAFTVDRGIKAIVSALIRRCHRDLESLLQDLAAACGDDHRGSCCATGIAATILLIEPLSRHGVAGAVARWQRGGGGAHRALVIDASHRYTTHVVVCRRSRTAASTCRSVPNHLPHRSPPRPRLSGWGLASRGSDARIASPSARVRTLTCSPQAHQVRPARPRGWARWDSAVVRQCRKKCRADRQRHGGPSPPSASRPRA